MILTQRSSKRHPKGFTLIEIFVVIAILATLATMGWQANKMITARRMNKTAEIQISQMELGMNSYRQDYGDVLPEGDGDEWSAHVLYKALYCDEDGDGEPDTDKKTGEPRVPYCENITPMGNIKKAAEVLNGIPAMRVSVRPPETKKKRKCFVIMDPWGKPYRYRLGYELKDERGRAGKGVNPDFDIFSQGPDGMGNGLTNLRDNEDNVSNIRSWE